jgi:hypothetical protein
MAAGAPRSNGGRSGANFELERLVVEDGRLLVSGWWSGVRGMRFVRPALVVEGRQVLATLEHKPWAADGDGAWTAAFPWDDEDDVDIGSVMLSVAPSVEVPLDRDAAPPQPFDEVGRFYDRGADYADDVPILPEPKAVVEAPAARAVGAGDALRAEREALERALGPQLGGSANGGGAPEAGGRAPQQLAAQPAVPAEAAAPAAQPAPAAEAATPAAQPAPAAEAATPAAQPAPAAENSNAAPAADDRRVETLRSELDEAHALVAARDARIRELEQEGARQRRAAHDAEVAREAATRSYAMAIADRDRALAQLEEAVSDREAAIRTRARMEAQRDEAIAQRETAEARRNDARTQRNEARRQRDEALVAHRALQKQLKSEWAQADRARAIPDETGPRFPADEPDEDDPVHAQALTAEEDERAPQNAAAALSGPDAAAEPAAAAEQARQAHDVRAAQASAAHARHVSGVRAAQALARDARRADEARAAEAAQAGDARAQSGQAGEGRVAQTHAVTARTHNGSPARAEQDSDGRAVAGGAWFVRDDDDQPTQSFDVLDEPEPEPEPEPDRERERERERERRARDEQPIGVRVIPATRTVGAHLHRAERAHDSGVTRFDLWAFRVLGTVAAVSFITLLVMILKAFFIF